ncbi:hypothetical protein [Streptomyces sp. x-19]|uniref:hypothetical protein n=1 Tax=Streptomyces sp. x-19 TaxID=2789280 RepID=UPI00397EB766
MPLLPPLVGAAVSPVLIASPVQAAGSSGEHTGGALAVSLGDSCIVGEEARWFGNSLDEDGGDTEEDATSIRPRL